MKYFKKFLLLGIFTLLLVSFCSAGSYTYNGHFDSSNDMSWGSYFYEGNFGKFYFPTLSNSFTGIDISCDFSNFSGSDISSDNNMYPFSFGIVHGSSFSYTYIFNSLSLSTIVSNGSRSRELLYNGYTNYINDGFYYVFHLSLSRSYNFSFDYSCSFTADKIYGLGDIYLSVPSSSCDYSEYESQISTLQSQLNTATGSLATCNSNLSSCNTSLNTATGSLATCQSNLNTATGSLATCQNDLTSCQNNSSSSSSSCEATGYISDYISGNILFSGSKSFGSAGYTNMFNYGDYGAGTYCLKFSSSSPQTLSMGFANGGSTAPTNLYSLYNDQYGNWICLYGNKPYLNVKLNSSSNTINYEVYKLTDLLGTQFQCPVQSLSGYILESSVNSQYCVNNGLCPSCPDQYTSLQCQEEYNLIPINDINENYCTLNFDLISPSDCPSSPSGSGTSRSALYVNNVQYLGSPSIYVNIPEIIDRNYTYNSGNMILDVEGYNVNTGYMADILTVQEYHPSSEDFTVAFVSFLTLVLPYVIVTLFVIFVRKLLRKIFKS